VIVTQDISAANQVVIQAATLEILSTTAAIVFPTSTTNTVTPVNPVEQLAPQGQLDQSRTTPADGR
jgi:hypothetical protein